MTTGMNTTAYRTSRFGFRRASRRLPAPRAVLLPRRFHTIVTAVSRKA